MGFLSLVMLRGLAVAAEASPDALEEVTVTATKLKAERVLDLPASVQAISSESLQRDMASGIMSIAGQVPGLSIQDLGPGDKKYVIRGINSIGDSTTGVYYGEAVITQGNSDDGGGFQPDIRLYDLDHVEVLRGPQGTLYGASSMSGTIRYIPKDPVMDKVEGYINLEDSWTTGGGNNYNVNGALNLPILDNVLSLRLVGWKLYDSGYVNQIRVGAGVTAESNGVVLPVKGLGYVKGVNDDDVGGGRAILRYQPTDKLWVDLDYTAQSESSKGSSRWTPPGVTAFNGGPIAPGPGLRPVQHRRHPEPLDRQHQGLRRHDQLGYRQGRAHGDRPPVQPRHRLQLRLDPGAGVVRRAGARRDARAARGAGQRRGGALRQRARFPGELRGRRLSQSVRRQDLTVQVITTGGNGLPTGPFSEDTAQDALAFPGVGNTFFGRTDHRTVVQWAGFGEATWKITDAWTAVAGLRYFTETLNGVQVQTHPFGGFPGSPNLVPLPDPEETFNKVTWKANLSYKFNEGLLAYGTVSTGFRGGGLNAVSEPFEPIPASYEPDTLTNYELGAKGRLANGLFDYQLDAFFINWSNTQVQLTTPDGAFVYIGNVGQHARQGGGIRTHRAPLPVLHSLAGRFVAGCGGPRGCHGRGTSGQSHAVHIRRQGPECP